MNDPNVTREKIISVIRLKGPSLPVQIAREAQISSLFAGAFLSELAREEVIKISNTKVGGSPLYYKKGQEHLLDNFYKYLPEKEREAFLMLKQHKILQDSQQVPAIRVALRSIKDFAVPFKRDEDVFWRFHTTTEEEVRGLLEPKAKVEEAVKEVVKQPVKQVVKQEPKQPVSKSVKKEVKEKQLDLGLKQPENKRADNFENPLVMKEERLKEKGYSEFVSKIVEKVKKKYEVVEEKYHKPKEYCCVVQVKSDLGPINFLTFAKDKKKLSETDVKQIVSQAQKIPLPALILYKGELSKKALEYSVKYFSVLKLEKI